MFALIKSGLYTWT